jgi:hypothetical protein
MHLNRERVAHVEKFQQQREPAETPGQFSQHLLRPLMKQLSDMSSFHHAAVYSPRRAARLHRAR